MATSMFVLNWMSRSFVSVTAPSRMPWNSTPYLSSKVFASATKYSEFIFIAYGWLGIADDLIARAGNLAVRRPRASSP